MILGLALFDARTAASGFTFNLTDERLAVSDRGQPVADYVFKDSTLLRPYFANVRAPGGIQITRNHPPVEGQDPTDHSSMHPGIWLAFGDVSGEDFWRNKGTIQHDEFLVPPQVHAVTSSIGTAGNRSHERLSFTTRNRLLSADGREICIQVSKIALLATSSGYLLVWDATFESNAGDFSFGDQEEMGLGIRMATPATEKNGGRIVSSAGQTSAAATWGKAADWCDYSGVIMGRRVGATIMPDPGNFRPSWFHNRNYGLMVANPFGRKAFKQGAGSRVIVKKNTPFHLRFGILLHSAPLDQPVDIPAAYTEFIKSVIFE